jgi:predicted ABC-type ATPase
MLTPKFRLFAGPNASGKTYVFKKIRKGNLIPKEIYVNADKIEAEPQAFGLADSAFVIDNSDEARLILKKENSILYRAAQFPAILRKELASIVRRFPGAIKEISN